MRGNSIVRHFGESYDRHRARRRLLEVVLVAGGVHRVPDRAQGAAQDGRAAVPLLGPVAGRVARDRARRLRRQRGPRRRDSRRPLAKDRRRCSSASIGSASTRRTVPASRSSRCRSRATRTSTRRAASCSTTASTSPSPPTRSCRRARSGSASRSPPPTRTPRSSSSSTCSASSPSTYELRPARASGIRRVSTARRHRLARPRLGLLPRRRRRSSPPPTSGCRR